jgi:DNA-binding CsgD family transcriptional regulator
MGLPSLVRPKGPGTAAAGELVDELRDHARTREIHTTALRNAIDALGSPDLFQSLVTVVEPLPLLLDADTATIRLSDEEGMLHLVAATGCPISEVRVRAVQPLGLQIARRLSDPETLQRQTEALGFHWAKTCWLGPSDAPIGSISLASRTQRRPRSLQLTLLETIRRRLSEKLLTIARTSANLRACSLKLARTAEPRSWTGTVKDEVADLRPRERSILDLYADGLSTNEVAGLLCISPHTVRTHVKSALRTLGVHSRADAARLVRTNQVVQVL